MSDTIHYQDAEGLKQLISPELGAWSPSVKVTQDMINQFADLSGDRMWLHVDVERCKTQSPFGGKTIAHGFLLLSMLSRFQTLPDVSTIVTGYRHMMNYGSDKLRFLNPVVVDSEIRARSRIKDIEVANGKTKVTAETELAAVGSDKPALIYEMAFVFV